MGLSCALILLGSWSALIDSETRWLHDPSPSPGQRRSASRMTQTAIWQQFVFTDQRRDLPAVFVYRFDRPGGAGASSSAASG